MKYRTMKTSVRNRMADLFLKSFNDSQKVAVIRCLSVFCKMAGRRARPQVFLGDLLGRQVSSTDTRVLGALQQLIGEGGLLRLRRADIREVSLREVPRSTEGIPWVVEPQVDTRAAWPAICERTRVYARLVERTRQSKAISNLQDPLRKAVAEATLCFNAGLFFEAHEHLEHYWAAQPRGPTRRFLQGIIQISVGFHHACLGKYDGAINQLAKGLEKTLGTTGNFLGLDCDKFLPKVVTVREAIVRRGRAHMTPLSLAEIPRMRLKK